MPSAWWWKRWSDPPIRSAPDGLPSGAVFGKIQWPDIPGNNRGEGAALLDEITEMTFFERLIGHLRTVGHHRKLVRHYCFRLGLYRQGLMHDLSKYSPAEFRRGVKYYLGYRSPNDRERRETGVSMAWLHHKGKNRHHFEYWVDYRIASDGSVFTGGCKMPIRYVAEMFCDRIAASRTYLKDAYTDASPYEYYVRSKDHILIHPETSDEIEEMLRILKDEGEDAAVEYVKKRLREG